MLDHFSRSELACPAPGHARLAAGFGEALESAFASNAMHQYTLPAPAGRLSAVMGTDWFLCM